MTVTITADPEQERLRALGEGAVVWMPSQAHARTLFAESWDLMEVRRVRVTYEYCLGAYVVARVVRTKCRADQWSTWTFGRRAQTFSTYPCKDYTLQQVQALAVATLKLEGT